MGAKQPNQIPCEVREMVGNFGKVLMPPPPPPKAVDVNELPDYAAEVLAYREWLLRKLCERLVVPPRILGEQR